jgi:putative flavoprotein involved in K+ transport
VDLRLTDEQVALREEARAFSRVRSLTRRRNVVPERIETVVVGAGQAGLATSYHLTQRGRDHVVLERGLVGETWRSKRWDGFVLNTPNWAQQLPGFHYTGSDPDGFAPLPGVIAYLEEYARAIPAPVRERVEVTRVRRTDRGFAIETSAGELDADNVVIAAGAYQSPTSTSLTRAVPATTFQLHTSEYRRSEQLPSGAVLVVGSGQSGCQISEELLGAGRPVYLSVGRCPWLPRRYRGRELVHWLLETGLADETPESLPSPAARLICNPPVSGNEGGHDCNPRSLADRGANLVGRVEGIEDGVVRLGHGVEESLANGDAFVANFKRRVDEYVSATGLDVPEPEGAETRAPVQALTELDLHEAGIGTILWANGFRPDHSWIEGVDTDEQGWPVHDRGVSPVPGLFFVGLHWLHKRKSSLFLGVGEDAAHVADRLNAR